MTQGNDPEAAMRSTRDRFDGPVEDLVVETDVLGRRVTDRLFVAVEAAAAVVLVTASHHVLVSTRAQRGDSDALAGGEQILQAITAPA